MVGSDILVRGAPSGVTRSRLKVDRIACPWLIRRFVDPHAVVLFVAFSEVMGVADRFGATPFAFEGEGTFRSHRGERCTFDIMVEESGLATEPLLRLATIVREADTARPGLLPASLGLSRMYSGDPAQARSWTGTLRRFYRWCRDATDETHNWPSRKPGA